MTPQRRMPWSLTPHHRVIPVVCRSCRGAEVACGERGRTGAGRPFSLPGIRDALFEWWIQIRFAVDWTELAKHNNAKGKKCLCRFPRAVIRWKVDQLLAEYAASVFIAGSKKAMRMMNVTSRWLACFENEYGVSFRQANRRYEVSRTVRKQRMEICWANLFRVRQYILLEKNYDPVPWNFDQTPYYQNETGAQNKKTLAVKGSVVPLVEGRSDAHSRWTACLSCCSCRDRRLGGV